MIGDTIKQLRKVHNLSQEAFASKIGVSQTTVTSWETGKAEPASSIIVKIANYFNVSTDFILDVDNSKQPFSLGNKIKQLRKIHNLNQSELGKYSTYPNKLLQPGKLTDLSLVLILYYF